MKKYQVTEKDHVRMGMLTEVIVLANQFMLTGMIIKVDDNSFELNAHTPDHCKNTKFTIQFKYLDEYKITLLNSDEFSDTLLRFMPLVEHYDPSIYCSTYSHKRRSNHAEGKQFEYCIECKKEYVRIT